MTVFDKKMLHCPILFFFVTHLCPIFMTNDIKVIVCLNVSRNLGYQKISSHVVVDPLVTVSLDPHLPTCCPFVCTQFSKSRKAKIMVANGGTVINVQCFNCTIFKLS